MEVAQNVVYLTRAMRAKNNLKVRQPFRKIMVALDKCKHEALSKMKDVVLEEVNIKELIILMMTLKLLINQLKLTLNQSDQNLVKK